MQPQLSRLTGEMAAQLCDEIQYNTPGISRSPIC